MEAREENGATAATAGNHQPPPPLAAELPPAPAPATHEIPNPAPVGTPFGTAAPQVTPSLTAPLSFVAVGTAPIVGPTPAGSPAVPGASSGVMKKKRGRPRKYAPDGTVLTPAPIATSVPPSGEYLAAAAVAAALKRGRGRPGGYVRKRQQQPLQIIEFESLGEMVACSAGANFTPHFITVPAGEDVTMKIISFSQQGPRAVCILSANGVISNATLRQSDSSGGTLTYEGRFELLSLSGSFTPTENGGPRSRTGGMSVSMASPDGRVVGGAVAGLLVASSPVQVVVGSFLPSYQMEQKTKKQKVDTATTAIIPLSVTETEAGFATGQMQTATPTPAIS